VGSAQRAEAAKILLRAARCPLPADFFAGNEPSKESPSSRDRFSAHMRRTILVLAAIAALPVCAEQRFSAADVPGIGIHKTGKIVISNTSRSINAIRVAGNVHETLVSFQATLPRVPIALPSHISAAIEDAAQTHGVDARLLTAVARRESAFNENALSPAGAVGVMQLMPATARILGVNAYDTRDNIFGAARYLRSLLDTFHGDLDLTLAAYNAGPGAVHKFGGVPPYRETQAYVRSVRASYESALR
jgi:soluble lytic murein transglycosylase-like protein